MTTLTLSDFPAELQQCSAHFLLSAREILVQQHEPADYLFWVISGQIRLVSFVDEMMITHYFVEANELFNEGALYFNHYRCTAIAEVPSEVISFPTEAFINALKQYPELSSRYLESLTHRFCSIRNLLELRSIYSARDRFLSYLVKRLSPSQTTVTLEKPLRAIASELAITPESLSRLLSRLQTEGIIKRKKRCITFSQTWLEGISEDVRLSA
ncbi:MAG: Crp/Fnr family transcriptional regulator [Cyanobacteria bacterium P01_E01_bin.6]